MTSYSTCEEAVNTFKGHLLSRGIEIAMTEKVKAYAGNGKYVFEDRIYTSSREIYHIKCRPRGRWIPKSSDQVSAMGKALDERYKFIIKNFGKGDPSISGVNEDTMLDILESEAKGYIGYLVTIYPQTGEILWCRVNDAYEFIMTYGTLPQFSFQGMQGMTFCSLPTGWMKKWNALLISYPESGAK
jgi:hypothetical protein